MTRREPKTIRFRGRSEEVLEIIHVGGRNYFALEKLSSRGAFRVFDSHAGPDGDYRVLYRIPQAKLTHQKIELLRRLGGPTANRNFPQIVDFAHSGSDFLVVIDWVWGTNLRDYLRSVREQKTPRPSVSEVVRLVRGLAHGVAHYHRRAHVIHGDISPANIVLTSGTTQLVLVDFGSAWPAEQTATKEIGDGVTRPYAAPERLAGHAAEDYRADMFSLSVVAYELLTLDIPFDGLGGQAGLPHLARETEKSYRPPSQLIPKAARLPSRAISLLDDCLRSGLALHPDERFATPSESLTAWDELHFALKKGSRLSRFEEKVLGGMESVAKFVRRKKG